MRQMSHNFLKKILSEKSTNQEDQVGDNFAYSDLPEGRELPGVQKAEVLASQDESVFFKAIFAFYFSFELRY